MGVGESRENAKQLRALAVLLKDQRVNSHTTCWLTTGSNSSSRDIITCSGLHAHVREIKDAKKKKKKRKGGGGRGEEKKRKKKRKKEKENQLLANTRTIIKPNFTFLFLI